MNSRLFTIALLLLNALNSQAQPGCTDPYATNYNPGATSNDGSCTYPVTHDTMVLRTQLPVELTESSGLLWDNGKLWSHNDSGNPATLFNIDTTDGHIIQKVYVTNYTNIDWEDITADNDYIYIGDFGNNNGDRTDLRVLKIAKADITADTAVNVTAQLIEFSYADQVSHASNPLTNYDGEALVSIGDSLYVFTKDRSDNQTRVYKMPKAPGTYSLSPYTSYNVGGLITAASYNPNTHEILLLGYTLLKTNSFLWFLNDYNGDMFFSGNKRRVEIGGTSEWQTEAVEFISANRFFLSNETATVNASLYIGHKNWLTGLNVEEANSNVKAINIHPNPVSSMLYVDNVKAKTVYKITDMNGRTLLTGVVQPGDNTVKLEKLKAGTYTLQLQGDTNASHSFVITMQ